ncbi:Tat (twin-arginine translocation) pathway signal sequence containing protein [Marinigracilibium pacificum]|uniref:Tat (Twin-arginine translocation) pathway signal sequence containing protein n=1 Tax=Marinigracilibium pacificum TaxID=2729599 RepID=A0A848J001_9BACT|nr:Tat (twin-arginine translocation) pathway signal sequence containing protein [Marinigracilibium pacificum]NMM47579.1 Tat (twin-arginine translocation) pathway signal sequence containing protein [Marinigracilibium pacificum]
MIKNHNHSRREFLGSVAAGTAAGLAMITSPIEAKIKDSLGFDFKGSYGDLDAGLKHIGKMQHPIAYDVSQANWWGFIWSNVYYMTNDETGTPNGDLGVINVLRHHGIIFSFKDEVIEKYKLGEVMGYKDPTTGSFAVKNPYIDPQPGAFPLPGLAGINGLMEKGTMVCVCNMAYKVYSGKIAEKMGLKPEDVYSDFVNGKLPGIHLAPSGVWVLGRLAENNIGYIDSSVG